MRTIPLRALAMLLAGFLPTGPGVAQPRPETGSPPDAVTLLTRAIDAQARLGPAIITGRMMAVVPKCDVSLGIAFTRRQNDPTHYTEVSRMVGEGMTITTDGGKEAVVEMTRYRNGGEVTTYYGTDNTWEVESSGDEEQSDLAMSAFAAGLKDRKRAAEWKKLPVTVEKLDGSETYRFIVKGLRVGDDKQDVRVYVDPRSYLIRRLMLLDKKGGGLSYTWTIAPQDKRFPKELLTFSPPPGAKRKARAD